MMKQTEQHKSEFVVARVTPVEKMALYKIGSKRGGLSAAIRHLIREYSRNDNRAGNVRQDQTSAVVPNN